MYSIRHLNIGGEKLFVNAAGTRKFQLKMNELVLKVGLTSDIVTRTMPTK